MFLAEVKMLVSRVFRGPCDADQFGCSTRIRSRSSLARLYIWRFRYFSRLIWPSTWPLLQGELKAARTAGAAQLAQHRGSADRHAELSSKPRRCLTTERVAERPYPLHQAQRSAPANSRQRINALGKRPLHTAPVDALEAPNLDGDPDGKSKRRTVGEAASVVAVQAATPFGAPRTGCSSDSAVGFHRQPATVLGPRGDALAGGLQRLRQSGDDDHGALACSNYRGSIMQPGRPCSEPRCNALI